MSGRANAGLYRSAVRWLLFLSLLLPAALPASARDWRVTDFHSTIGIAQDGRASITERITVEFNGEFHGIYRDIPIQYPAPHGSNYTLFLKVQQVTDDTGHKLKYESSVSNGARHLKIYIPGAVDTTKTVQIVYTT